MDKNIIIPERFTDRMVMKDIIIGSRGHNSRPECAVPHGRLYEVVNFNPDSGIRVLREVECNTVVVGGAITALENLAGVTAEWRPGTLNDIHTVPATPSGSPKLALFGAGIGGSGLDFGSVIAPDIKQRDVISPVPLRYGATVTGDDAAKYFMKATNAGGTTYSWFLKEFAAVPSIKSCWKNSINDETDGTVIVSEIYNSTNTEGIETFMEIQITLNNSDIREYFEAVGQLSSARYNTIGFYTGSKNAGGTEYGDVRLYSLITFNNRDVSTSTTSSYVYRLYGLI